jgi:AcrR family transcriptional regulator
MQRPDEHKRQAIVTAAAELFASRPFHEVRLDDVAAAAHIGKGTLYVYFKSKEDLYASLVRDGFTRLVEKLRAQIEAGPALGAWETLSLIVHEFVAWAYRNPNYFQLMREHQVPPAGLREKRKELAGLIEATIRRGVKAGELADPRPDLTAQFVPGLVRSVLRHGPPGVGQEALANHILRVLGGGIRGRGAVEGSRGGGAERTDEGGKSSPHGRVARAAAAGTRRDA